MAIFHTALEQMLYLLVIMMIGFIIAKLKAVPENTPAVLSRVETVAVFPASIFISFATGFTAEKLTVSGQLVFAGLCVMLITVPMAFGLGRLFSKDTHDRRIYIYDFIFANYGLMGKAVVNEIFPQFYAEYSLFVFVPQLFLFGWLLNYLLLYDENDPDAAGFSIKKALRSMISPSTCAMVAGIIFGLAKIPVPSFIASAFNGLSRCLAPMAMLLTGMFFAKMDNYSCIKDWKIYIASAIRLIIIPGAAVLAAYALKLPMAVTVCMVSFLTMPLGVFPVVYPGSLGRDVTVASGMALVSQVLGCGTIPLIYMFMNLLMGY